MSRRQLARGICRIRTASGDRFRARYRDHEGRNRSRTFIEYSNALAWLRERQVETERIKSGLAPPPKPPVPRLRDFAAEVVTVRMFKAGANHLHTPPQRDRADRRIVITPIGHCDRLDRPLRSPRSPTRSPRSRTADHPARTT